MFFVLGWTPLHEACSYGHYNVATLLVKAGANVNAKGFEDNTPLHDAATNGNLKLVKMLYEKGADPCLKNRKGKTPIDVAGPPVYNFLLSIKGKSYIYINFYHFGSSVFAFYCIYFNL